MSVVGKAVSHESALAHVRGSAEYVDDYGADTPRLGHAWPVMAPHARARVLHIHREAALAEPGVLAVLTADDVTGDNDVGPARRDEPLFPDEVMFWGQPVAWLIADSIEHARLAATRVEVSYEPLPAILSIEEAIAQRSFHTEPERMQRGQPLRALADAELTLDGEILIGGQEHFYLETQVALARYGEVDGVFVQSSTQHPAETQEIIARVLGLKKHDVIVQCPRMGGAFGGKEVQANAWAAVAALGAVKLKRPVRVRLTRYQDMTMTGKRHPFLARFRAGADASGRLTALSVELFSDGGWSLDLSAPVLNRAMFHLDNCYLVPHLEVVGRVCKTNYVSHTAFRGFGGPQGMLVIEEVLDRIARRLGLPPDVVRQRNFYGEGDRTHYGQLVKDAERIPRIWNELKRSSDFEARALAVGRFNEIHRNKKRGIAITPVKFGISFTTAFFNQAGALVLIYKDGSVQVNHGGTEMGQGLHTKMQQIAADALGLPPEAVRIMPTRTDKVPNTSATAASASSDLNGAAIAAACAELRERLAEVAARRFGAGADELEFASGAIRSRIDPTQSATFADVVMQAYLERTALFATGYYRTPDLHFDKDAGTGKPFHYFAYGAAVSEVEVDTFTGQYVIRRVDILHDAGDSLSPAIDRGQVEGGFMQGLGWLTCEQLTYDREGKLTSSGASTYKLPSVGECPPIFNVALLERASEPGVVHGSKAVGEPPLMLALSVREALRSAIAACADKNEAVELGVPATPEAVFWAIQRRLGVYDQTTKRGERSAAE